jgi:hypothetical protein
MVPAYEHREQKLECNNEPHPCQKINQKKKQINKEKEV